MPSYTAATELKIHFEYTGRKSDKYGLPFPIIFRGQPNVYLSYGIRQNEKESN